jgi:hypothetical protein
MRSQQDHERGIKQAQAKLAYWDQQKHGERQGKRDLHAQEMQRVFAPDGRRPTADAKQQLRDRKDEKSAAHQFKNGGVWRYPGSQCGGHKPESGRDKLSEEAPDVNSANFLLSVLHEHKIASGNTEVFIDRSKLRRQVRSPGSLNERAELTLPDVRKLCVPGSTSMNLLPENHSKAPFSACMRLI